MDGGWRAAVSGKTVLRDHLLHESCTFVAPLARHERMLVPEEHPGDTPRKAARRQPGKRVPGASHRNRLA